MNTIQPIEQAWHDEVVFRASGIAYRKAGPSDDDILRQVLRSNAMDAWVKLSTEHEPSYFATSQLFGETHTLVAYTDDSENDVVGMCSWTLLPGHVNGVQTTCGYLGELRVMPKYRNRLKVIRNGFHAVQELGSLHNPAFWFTSIAEENLAAKRLLEAQLSGMPLYRPRGRMFSLALSSRLGKSTSLLHSATREDIPELVRFYNDQQRMWHYAPVLTESWLAQLDGRNGLKLEDFYLFKRDGKILATIALWDQRHFKQTVVRGYRFPLNILRQAYNLYAGLTKHARLHGPGQQIDYIFLAFLAVAQSEQSSFITLIREALYQTGLRGAELGMLGLSAENVLLQQILDMPNETYITSIDSVDWPDEKAVELDGRLVQPEIALL